MNRIPIADYVGMHGQQNTATKLGLTQGAISKMLRVGRNVFVIEQVDGSIEAIEERPVGRISRSNEHVAA